MVFLHPKIPLLILPTAPYLSVKKNGKNQFQLIPVFLLTNVCNNPTDSSSFILLLCRSCHFLSLLLVLLESNKCPNRFNTVRHNLGLGTASSHVSKCQIVCVCVWGDDCTWDTTRIEQKGKHESLTDLMLRFFCVCTKVTGVPLNWKWNRKHWDKCLQSSCYTSLAFLSKKNTETSISLCWQLWLSIIYFIY